MRKTFTLMFGLAAILSAPCETRAAAADAFHIVVLSSRPETVSGGDALVRIDAPQGASLDKVIVTLNGQDVTGALHRDPAVHALTGLVTGLKIGENSLEVFGGAGQSEPAEKLKACKAYALESSSITPGTEHGINFLTAWMTVAVMARSFHQSALRNTESEVSAPSSQRRTGRWPAAEPIGFQRTRWSRRPGAAALLGSSGRRRLLLESPAHARRESSCNVYRGTADAWFRPENAKRQCWANPAARSSQ